MSEFKEVSLSELTLDPFRLIGKEWMLISAGNREKYNTMTASWGGLGVMWGKDVSVIVVRPQRYTLEFIDREDCYSLCFFEKEHHDALSYCGSHSGRDVDKVAEMGLIPCFDGDVPYFGEAKLVLLCKKLYRQPLDPACFIDRECDTKWYPEKDYHFALVGEIVKVLVKK